MDQIPISQTAVEQRSPGKCMLSYIVRLAFALACVLLMGCTSDRFFSEPFVLWPAELLEQNDFVGTCKLVYVEQIADLGTIEYVGTDIDYYVLEYTFQPTERFKADTEDSLVFLWYCAGLWRQTSGRSELKVTPDLPTLIYGKHLSVADSLLNMLRPWINCSTGEFHEMYEQRRLSDRPVDMLDMSDFELASRIMNSLPILERRLLESGRRGRVLYGTDFLYQTHFEAESGRMNCRHASGSGWREFTTTEYLEELRSPSD